MKTKWNFKKLITDLLIAVFVLTASSELIAQEKKTTDLKNFRIVIEKTDSGITLKSIEGSAWIDLSFSLNNCRPQAVDEYGMTALNKVSPGKDTNLADFLFTIAETEDRIVLTGIEGTEWTDLSFSLVENGKQAIDQYGMAKLD